MDRDSFGKPGEFFYTIKLLKIQYSDSEYYVNYFNTKVLRGVMVGSGPKIEEFSPYSILSRFTM